MKQAIRKALLRPPPHLVDQAREAGLIEASKDPEELILLYGLMITDCEIAHAELESLLHSARDYRSKLRVIRGAAKRLMDRSARLMGEK